MRFTGKTAVITGGTSGIGKLCAICFAREGGNVVVTARHQQGIDETVAEIRKNGGSAIGIAADVHGFDQASSVCAGAIREFGRIDVLINSAGGASGRLFNYRAPYHEVPIEYIDWGIDVNLKGPLYFSHEAMRYMAQQNGGAIVLLGSIAGAEGAGEGGSVDYSAAKSALMNGVVKSLAQNGAPWNIRVNTVSPGPVLTREAMAGMKTLVGRAARPQEIVDLILYLCSDQAAFITGANYMIDGGRSCLIV